MRTTTFIYTLSCPISGDVRYIGKANEPNERLYKHISQSRKEDLSKDYKSIWIKSLTDINLKPILTIVSEVLISSWKKEEKYYILKFRNLGCDLFNSTSGSNGLSFGNKTSFDGSHRRSVVLLDKNGNFHKRFNSCLEASKYLNLNNIWSSLSGKTNTSGGYITIYEDVYVNMSYDDIKSKVSYINRDIINGLETRFKSGQIPWNKGTNIKLNPDVNVNQYTKEGKFIKTWISAKKASMYLVNEDKSLSICQCARKNRSNGELKYSSIGYIWSYTIK